jgi:protein-disulfide isomerase
MTISEPTDRTGVIGIMALAVSVRRSAQGCPQGGAVVEPLDDTVDHVRGGSAGRSIVEYGDYECPCSRAAFRAIERVERELRDGVRFAFRHFPLTEIHDRAGAGVLARASAGTSRAASRQARSWALRPCSSTASCIGAHTTPPHYCRR